MVFAKRNGRRERGQSLVELSLFIPILLFMIIGMAELGVFVSVYIDAQDASRASARYVSPLDPSSTRCQRFGYTGPTSDNRYVDRWITDFDTNCMSSGQEYHDRALEIKGWGVKDIYAVCKGTPTLNFMYVAGCMAVRNTPEGFLDPANNFDDVIVTIVPIAKNGAIAPGAVTWSFFGNQPGNLADSVVVTITNPSDLSFDIRPDFAANVGQYASAPAPATGLVVVEVYHAHPQLTKLYWAVSRLAGGRATIPDPIPIHTYTIFPLPAAEPR